MKLAKLHIPSGTDCLGSDRIEELSGPQAGWTPEEEQHLQACNWCRYLWVCGAENCFPIVRLLALSLGAEPTTEERDHLAQCPVCSWEYQELCQPEAQDARADTRRAAASPR
jgi:hypothetical protein